MKPQLPDGYTAAFLYDRPTDDAGRPLPKGGVTHAGILDPEGVVVAEGIARCSGKDSFNRRIGRDIALGRALKRMRFWDGAEEARQETEARR